MGDRTYCNLNLQKPADHGVQALIEDHIGIWNEDDGNLRWFGFEEVNYAQLPDAFVADMVKLELAFSWSWAAGGSYGPGVIICDGKTTREWDTNVDGDIVLSLDAVRILERVAEAEHCDAIYTAVRQGKEIAA